LSGKSVVELCCIHSIHISNRRLYNDVAGNCICLTYNGASVVDYHIVSSNIFSHINYFNDEKYHESDHLPVCATFTLERGQLFVRYNNENETFNELHIDKYRWNDRHMLDFLQ
jgi:hypothetical protein